MATATKGGLVKFDMENLGEEIWLVANPAETRAAFDGWQEGDGPDASPLDAAASVSEDAVVLRAHWGNDIPAERDEQWLHEVCATARNPDEVRQLVESWWAGEA